MLGAAITMYGQFSDTVRQIMMSADSEAKKHRHDYIGCLHIIVGAIDVSPSLFESVSIEVARLRKLSVDRLDAAHSSGAKSAIDSAINQAHLHNSSVVDVAHLMIGVLSQPDDAVRLVFSDAKLDIDLVRKQLTDNLHNT